MDKIQIFTSTGSKLIHHPSVIHRMKTTGKATPVSLQIAPTSRCNLNCVFCSNVNRNKHEDLDVRKIWELLTRLGGYGLRTVEWTGGGDPTLYSNINACIWYASKVGLKQGFITNGIQFRGSLDPKTRDILSWVRVSMNSLDYVGQVDLPTINGTLGFSYVWNERTSEDILRNLKEHVKKYQPEYVRIVPNCQVSAEIQVAQNEYIGREVGKWGFPYFFQPKVFTTPLSCWWAYMKPFVLHDGWVYPCSSVVLNDTSDRQFHEKFRWVKMEELHSVYDYKMNPLETKHCTHCVFGSQNDLIEQILNPQMQEFI